MKLISSTPNEMPTLREKDIIAIDNKPYRILSKSIFWDKEGSASNVLIQLLALEVSRVEIKQADIKMLEDYFDSGRLQICEDTEIYQVPRLKIGDTAVLDTRYRLIQAFTESLYPDFRALQTRGIEKAEMQRLARLLKLSYRQTRRLVLCYLQSGQNKSALVDGRQLRIQHGYDPRAGAVRGRKSNGISSAVLNDKDLDAHFEEAYQHLHSILNSKQFQMQSQKRPTAKMAYKWMIREFYSCINSDGDKVQLPKNEIPSYKRFTRWLRKEKYGDGKIKDHTIGHRDWINNRRLLTGDSYYGVHHPGELVMLDETELSLDLVTADPERPGQNIGGAIIHLSVDAATNVWGLTVSIQVNNSYEGVLGIFENMMMDNAEKTNMLIGPNGYDDIRAFPDAIIPEHILVDHGAEYTCKALKNNLTGGEEYFQLEGIATDITLARVATGSDKGLVERPFEDFERQLADAVGYGHGYRSDTPRSKHRIEAHVNIMELRRIAYEIVKNHNNTPLTTYPVTPELVENVPGMTPLQLWDYLGKHYGFGITPDKRSRNIYRYSIMLKKRLLISRYQISYKNFLFWDIEGCKELYDIALQDKDKGQYIEVRIDPRRVSLIYYKDKEGTVYVLPLAKNRSNMQSFALYSWTLFDSWYKESLKLKRINQEKKENDRQKVYDKVSALVEESSRKAVLQNTGTSTKEIREAGAIERAVLTAYDNSRRDQIFGTDGLKVPVETKNADVNISISSLKNAEALPDKEATGDNDRTIAFNGFFGLDPDDV